MNTLKRSKQVKRQVTFQTATVLEYGQRSILLVYHDDTNLTMYRTLDIQSIFIQIKDDATFGR